MTNLLIIYIFCHSDDWHAGEYWGAVWSSACWQIKLEPGDHIPAQEIKRERHSPTKENFTADKTKLEPSAEIKKEPHFEEDMTALHHWYREYFACIAFVGSA